MKITNEATDEAILAELGGRLARLRLDRNLTQAQLAEEAGISKRTVERLEKGEVAPQLSGFIRVCRMLGLVERFELLVPEPTASPMALLRLSGKKRKRASGEPIGEYPITKDGSTGEIQEAAPPVWTWADDK